MSGTIACPFCKETIPAEAYICGKCQAVLVSQEWAIFCQRLRYTTPMERGELIDQLHPVDQEKLGMRWAALKMGAFPEYWDAEKRRAYRETVQRAEVKARRITLWIFIGAALIAAAAVVAVFVISRPDLFGR